MDVPTTDRTSASTESGGSGDRSLSSCASRAHSGDADVERRPQEERITCTRIVGLGTALPPHSIAQGDAARIAAGLGTTAKYQKSLELLYRRSGVRNRHSVLLETSGGALTGRQSFYSSADSGRKRGPSTSERMLRYESEAAGLAEAACQKALDEARLPAGSVTHLVTVSCSGFAAPGVDLALVDLLGLPRGVQRVHVGFMGCHGVLNGLRVARGLAGIDPRARVLLCAVELCSLHHQYTDNPQQLVANALFSDGAAAVLVQSAMPRDGLPGWDLVSQGSTVIPETGEMMSWRIGDYGFEMSLSPQVPEIILGALKPWMSAWLAGEGMAIDDVAGWAIHPGGPRILSAAAESLGLPPDLLIPSQSVLESRGNMSSPTVLFILEELRRAPADGAAVMLAFGPGLTIEAALLKSSRSLPSQVVAGQSALEADVETSAGDGG